MKEDRHLLECLRDMMKSVKDFFKRDWTLTEKILVILCCVMFGIIKGFLMAPIKKGVSLGNNNGNIYNQLEDDYWLDEEEDEE